MSKERSVHHKIAARGAVSPGCSYFCEVIHRIPRVGSSFSFRAPWLPFPMSRYFRYVSFRLLSKTKFPLGPYCDLGYPGRFSDVQIAIILITQPHMSFISFHFHPYTASCTSLDSRAPISFPRCSCLLSCCRCCMPLSYSACPLYSVGEARLGDWCEPQLVASWPSPCCGQPLGSAAMEEVDQCLLRSVR